MDRKEELLLHYGVKGQRWGVITRGRAAISRAVGQKKPKATSTSSEPKPKKIGRLKAEIRSVKRQLNWKKSVKNRKKMTDKELSDTIERIKNENNLRRLAPRKEYLKRANLSSAELKKRVDRLQLDDNLKKNVGVSTAAQREIGKIMVDTSLKIGIEMYKQKKGQSSKSAGVIVKEAAMKYGQSKSKIIDVATKLKTPPKP